MAFDAIHDIPGQPQGSRKVNQDRIAYTYSRDTLLLVVADGMGGHAGGEIAAQIAVRLFIERFQQEAKPILKNPLKFLQDSMLRAHAALGSYANQFSMLETPRTTCVACIVQAGHAYWAHVGDSRLYLYRQGGLIGQTKDHSKVQYLVDQGIIGAKDVAEHPDRNKIFSCLGGLVDPVIDLGKRTPLRNGDVIVMCTDGMWSVIRRRRCATWLTSTPILKTAPQMMREAEKRGGPDGDNLSAIVVRWGPETLTDEPSTTITETLGLGEFQTQIDRTLTLTDRKGVQRDLSDDEIERAIAEIQATIQRYRVINGQVTIRRRLREATMRPELQPVMRQIVSTPKPRASTRSRATGSSSSPGSRSSTGAPPAARVHFHLDPEREIDVGATEVHGMTWDDLSGKPKFGDIAAEFLDFARGAEWVIHNAPFDVAFLDVEFARAGMPRCAAIACRS